MNLFLRVVGKRKDGYHLVDSLMVPVSLYDEIEIIRPRGKAARGLSVISDHPLVPDGKRNLVFRAASLILKRKGLDRPVEIRLRKKIPVAAGLGGGSSDAAATLTALNRFFRLGCTRAEILSMALTLGADVPFFVYGRPARVRGIGDKVRPLASFPRLWMVLLYPGFGVSTRWVFGRLRLTKFGEGNRISFSLDDLERSLLNDLEKVTVRRYPRVAHLKRRLLEEGARGALMSGSGPTVFGIFGQAKTAREAFRRLSHEKGVQAYLVHTLN